MRILGIDPGFGRIGWGVIEGNKAQWRHVAHGCIQTAPRDTLAQRLAVLFESLDHIVETYQPDAAGIEELFFKQNVTTGIQVAQARGVLLLLLYKRNIPVVEIKPVQVKQAVTGYGHADKQQMMRMIRFLLSLPHTMALQDDAADALAIALASSPQLRTV